MRSLLAAILNLFLPASGKRRATTAATPDVHTLPVDLPLYGAASLAMREALRAETLRGEDVALVRPYVAALPCCADCGSHTNLEEMTVSDADGSLWDAWLCGSCAAVAA